MEHVTRFYLETRWINISLGPCVTWSENSQGFSLERRQRSRIFQKHEENQGFRVLNESDCVILNRRAGIILEGRTMGIMVSHSRVLLCKQILVLSDEIDLN